MSPITVDEDTTNDEDQDEDLADIDPETDALADVEQVDNDGHLFGGPGAAFAQSQVDLGNEDDDDDEDLPTQQRQVRSPGGK